MLALVATHRPDRPVYSAVNLQPSKVVLQKLSPKAMGMEDCVLFSLVLQ
jgi:hypothetical protein